MYCQHYCLLPNGYCLIFSHQRHLNPLLADDLDKIARSIAVSYYMMHLVEIADLTESLLAELGGVSQHNHLLGSIYHVLVEMGLGYVTCSQAMVKVECPLFEHFYVDFLGLLKEDGRWRIVNALWESCSLQAH